MSSQLDRPLPSDAAMSAVSAQSARTQAPVRRPNVGVDAVPRMIDETAEQVQYDFEAFLMS